MASGIDSSPNSGSQDPYAVLGLNPGATFEEVQRAREQKLLEVGDDPRLKALVESSYDSLLMVSLKERQLGKVSSAAINASIREEKKVSNPPLGNLSRNILNKLNSSKDNTTSSKSNNLSPNFALPEFNGLIIRIALALLVLCLTLVSTSGSIQLLLSLSTICLFISQIRRGRKPLSSFLWSLALLTLGLFSGALLIRGISGQVVLGTTFSIDQLEALPAILLLWSGTIFLE